MNFLKYLSMILLNIFCNFLVMLYLKFTTKKTSSKDRCNVVATQKGFLKRRPVVAIRQGWYPALALPPLRIYGKGVRIIAYSIRRKYVNASGLRRCRITATTAQQRRNWNCLAKLWTVGSNVFKGGILRVETPLLLNQRKFSKIMQKKKLGRSKKIFHLCFFQEIGK